jgi:hypothetical protein
MIQQIMMFILFTPVLMITTKLESLKNSIFMSKIQLKMFFNSLLLLIYFIIILLEKCQFGLLINQI